MKSKKDIGRLVPMVITDKQGKQTTVYVKPEVLQLTRHPALHRKLAPVLTEQEQKNKKGGEITMKGKRDITRLVPMVITDKRGRLTTVYVRPEVYERAKQKEEEEERIAKEREETMEYISDIARREGLSLKIFNRDIYGYGDVPHDLDDIKENREAAEKFEDRVKEINKIRENISEAIKDKKVDKVNDLKKELEEKRQEFDRAYDHSWEYRTYEKMEDTIRDARRFLEEHEE